MVGLSWSTILLILAVIAGLLGYAGLSGRAADFAKSLCIIFAVLWLMSILL